MKLQTQSASLRTVPHAVLKSIKPLWRKGTAALAILAWAGLSWAVDPFTVRDIRVEGLERTEPGTVFATLPIKVGETYTDDKAATAIRNLYALGLFQDVRLDVQGDVLVVVVQERSVVGELDIVGMKEFDKQTVIKALREVGLGQGLPFDRALVERAKQELQKQYSSRSFYAVDIEATSTPVDRNRVNIAFKVTENQVAKIKEISIKGTKAISESTLRGIIDLDTGSLMSWYTKSNRFGSNKLKGDLETIRAYYLARGFLEVQITKEEVLLSPDKSEVVIQIEISEGERFDVTGVELKGNYLGKEDEFKKLIEIKTNANFNADKVAETVQAFTRNFGSYGYAFAQVKVVPEINRTERKVNLVLQSEPGLRAYVRRINVLGNTKTRDEVIRREFLQFESGWYNGERIRRSRDRVDRLGYFNDVNIETQEVPGAPDQVDLNISVTEKPTGSFTLGAGYSSADKLSFQAGIKQDNIFGSGNDLSLNLDTSKRSRQAVASWTNPYFTQDGVSSTTDLYYRTQSPSTDLDTDYSIITQGGSVRFGIPFSLENRIFVGVGVEQIKLEDGTNMPKVYRDYADTFGYKSTYIPLTLGWGRDTRDSALAPNSGSYQRILAEWSPGGDAKYVKTTAQYQHYFPLTRQFTVAFNTELGWGKSLEDTKPYPIFKHFYSGGIGSVRGFEQSSLGPRDEVTDTAIGAAKKFNFNAEILAPFPGSGNDRTLRLFAFYDRGNVFGESDPIKFDQMRSSYGVGLNWMSPLGPLRLSYAYPIKPEDKDKIQKFQFSIGTSF